MARYIYLEFDIGTELSQKTCRRSKQETPSCWRTSRIEEISWERRELKRERLPLPMPKSTTVNTRLLQEDSLTPTDKQELLETTTFPLNQKLSLPLEPEGKFDWIIAISCGDHCSSLFNFPSYLIMNLFFSINKLDPKNKKILQLLRLRQLHNGVFVRLNKATINMLRSVEPYITYGYPS